MTSTLLPTPGRPARAGAFPDRVHLLGAGGAGVSGLGRILAAGGHAVSGSDRAASRFTDMLAAQGVPVAVEAALHVPDDAQLVVRSAAVSADDPAVVRALERGVPVIKYAAALARLAPARRTLAVAGTHGKTTTSWMLLHALRAIAREAGQPAPGALVGGVCRGLGTNALPREADGWFAVEACEYDRSFLRLSPGGAVITNVEADHLDYYGSYAVLEEAFARFADRVGADGLLCAGSGVPDAVLEAAPCAVWRLGHELTVDVLGEERGRYTFRLRGPGWATPPTRLAVPGEFNVENAALAIALAVGLGARDSGLSEARAAEVAALAVAGFQGAERRFEPWGRVGGVELFHDYAHHPTEVRVTLDVARRMLPGKPVHVLFQPHQASRTARFLREFVDSLRAADRVVVADVYGARAHIDRSVDLHGASARDLVERLRRAGVDAVVGGAPADAARTLVEGLPGGSAALVLGAGDIDLIRDELRSRLALRRRRGGAPRA